MQDEGTNVQQTEPQAGWVFSPGAAPQPAANIVPQAQPVAATPQPQSPNATSLPPLPTPEPSLFTQPQQTYAGEGIVAWTASEYIGNPKTMSWFVMLGGATLSVGVIVFFLTKDVVSTVVIAILGIILGVFAARQPHVLEYALDRSGIHLGERFYPYNFFKTFSVVEDGAFSHITLSPLKRFVPPITVHYAPNDEEKITNTLADYLPYEEHKADAIENFSRKVRF